MKDVSILVPIYNVGPYLKRCLISLFEQTYESIEYVFVNDASTDDSMHILYHTIDEYPDRKDSVRIINHQKNRGLAAARRTAIENCSSPYIIHIDSDDYIDKDMIRKMYKEVLLYKADLVLSDIIIEYVNSKKRINAGDISDKWSYLSMILTRKKPFNIWGKLIKREIVINNQIFAEEGINQGEDYQVFPRIVYYANRIRTVDSVYFYNKANQISYTSNITTHSIHEIIYSQQILNSFFRGSNKVDNNIICESCIYTKLSLLSVANYIDYQFIDSSFADIDYKSCNLSLSHKVVLFFLEHKFYKLTYYIIRVFLYLFRR